MNTIAPNWEKQIQKKRKDEKWEVQCVIISLTDKMQRNFVLLQNQWNILTYLDQRRWGAGWPCCGYFLLSKLNRYLFTLSWEEGRSHWHIRIHTYREKHKHSTHLPGGHRVSLSSSVFLSLFLISVQSLSRCRLPMTDSIGLVPFH